MICNRCGSQNENTYKFCLRCGNQLLPNNYNQPIYNKPKKNNTGIIVGVVLFSIAFIYIMIRFVLPILFFSSATSRLDTKYKVEKYLEEKYSDQSFTIVSGPTIVEVENSSCGNFKKYKWIVRDNNTNEEFEVESSKSYNGAFVCTGYNHDTYSKKR